MSATASNSPPLDGAGHTAVFVRLRYPDGCDPARLEEVARSAAGMFVGLQGLRSKAFTVMQGGREAVNVYLWQSRAQASALFTDAFADSVAAAYGVRPEIEFARVIGVVDNGTGTGPAPARPMAGARP